MDAGDRNTKYFHAVANARRRVNRINSILARDRVWEDKKGIQKEVNLFFRELYKGVNQVTPKMDGTSFRTLLTSSVSFLEAQFSKEEIKEAVFGSSGDWAPGPDGFPIAVFQNFWHLLEEDLQVFFNEFHVNGVITGDLGAAFLALIPKKDGAISIKDFRPISLIGSLYKILAKVLANRLRKVLPEIISEIQGAFVDGRQILDSIIVAHKCVDSRNRQHRPGLICKSDFEKAYDMVDWNFLQYMMKNMGFGKKWRD